MCIFSVTSDNVALSLLNKLLLIFLFEERIQFSLGLFLICFDLNSFQIFHFHTCYQVPLIYAQNEKLYKSADDRPLLTELTELNAL